MKAVLRTICVYAAMAAGVTVGGVVVGAIVVAPAVSRTKPLLERTLNRNASNRNAGSESKGSAVGQADGDPSVGSAAVGMLSSSGEFQPMADALAAARREQAKVASKPRRTGWAAVKFEVVDKAEDAMLFVGRIPKAFWLYADIAAVLVAAGIWYWRRQRQYSGIFKPLSTKSMEMNATAALPIKLVPGKSSRTPKAVAALAEAGNSPAAIARRTGLPLDAVSMLLSMGSFGARQLQPPTA